MNPLTTSVIIPTYNRPLALRRCLASILRQSRLPDELLIIDDGELAEHPLRQEFEDRGVHYVYHRKLPSDRGLTKSRNLGVRMSRGEVVFFLDDDVELFSDYLEMIHNVYRTYTGRKVLGGVGGMEIERRHTPVADICEWLFHLAFLMTPLRPGRVTMSGFSDQACQKVLPLGRPYNSEILGGSHCSFRRRVFDDVIFSEDMQGYCQGEDKDFSYRVSRRYLLLTQPMAKVYHDRSHIMRHDHGRRAEEYLLATYNFFIKHKATKIWSIAFFMYSATGYLIKWIIMTIFYRRSEDGIERIRGILKAIKLIMHEKKFYLL